jgi:hypothetical protein
MMSPLGHWIEIGHNVGHLLMTGASMVPKLAVLPVSAMAQVGDLASVGGPMVLIVASVEGEVDTSSKTLDTTGGFPPGQLRAFAGVGA